MLFTKEAYMAEVENKYISRKIHPSDPHLVILNYTENATYDKRWNEVTLACRGLIINEKTEEVVARPFPKFFNLGEMPDLESEIPFDEAPEVTIKQDGSLGISYKLNGKTYWATRGSFESEQAKAAQRIWDKKYANVEIPDEITLLTEIIDPLTKVVIDYQGISDLIIIGAINRFTGDDLSFKDLMQLGEALGMRVTERMKLTLDEAVALQSTIDSSNEGWVLRWANGRRLKIKGHQYLEVHKLAYGLSAKLKVEFWKNGEIQNLLLKVPEEFSAEIEAMQLKLDQHADNLSNKVTNLYKNALKHTCDRKSFAHYLNANIPRDVRYLVFKAFDNRLTSKDIKEHIYKNYSEYI